MSTNIDNRRLGFLDLIRGLAVFAVFCFHSVGVGFGRDQLPWGGLTRSFDVSWSFLLILPATLGSAGVALFFAVSGFCIHLSFQRNPDWHDFVVRRFFRIYPPYLFALLAFALFYPFTRLAFSEREDFLQLVSHLFLFHNLVQRFLFGINGAFWSVAVEVQLYALYPLLLLIIARLGWRRTMVVLGVVEVLIRTACYGMGLDAPRWIVSSPFTFWFSWSVGAYVAEAYLRNEKLPFATWSLAVMLAASIGSTFFSFLTGYSFLFFSWTTAAWISRGLTGSPSSIRLPRVISNHLRTAGIWSYSIYLIHAPLLTGIGLLLPHSKDRFLHHALIRFVICIASWALIMPVSGLVYRWCELPSIELGKRWLRRNKKGQVNPPLQSAVTSNASPFVPEAKIQSPMEIPHSKC